jgi:hypothetical protein
VVKNMRVHPITIIIMAAIVGTVSYWITIGMLALAAWMGESVFAGALSTWAVLQFLVVVLLGEDKRRKGGL